MDKLLYVMSSGAKQTMLAQAANNNNLANVSTPGFRADYAHFRSMPIYGEGYPTRVYAMTERSGTDLQAGPINTTGRDLDIAVKGQGWIAVQAPNGKEAYTRAGNLQVTSSNMLITGAGHPVIGNGGPISVPPANKIQIGEDGTLSIVPRGANAQDLQEVDRIKLVNPPASQLQKGNDGLMHLNDDQTAVANAEVQVASGALESSNVNTAEALVNMIDLSRQFEMQIRMMRNAEQNSDAMRRVMQFG